MPFTLEGNIETTRPALPADLVVITRVHKSRF